MSMMQAKMKIVKIEKGAESHALHFHVTGTSEENTFSNDNPSAGLTITVSNADLIGKFKVGQKYRLDFTLVD